MRYKPLEASTQKTAKCEDIVMTRAGEIFLSSKQPEKRPFMEKCDQFNYILTSLHSAILFYGG
jgi:hypothetical protein